MKTKNKQKNILAIHDISCIGRCALTVAMPIISSYGIQCSPLPTALLSSHGMFKDYYFKDLSDEMTEIIARWKKLELKFDAIYSGFIASPKQVDIVIDCLKNFKSNNAFTLVDPVMADNGKYYSMYNSDICIKMKELIQFADIITPNLTEAAFLLGEPYIGDDYDKEYIEATLRKLSMLGASKVILTGVSFNPNKTGAACYDNTTNSTFYAECDKIEGGFPGTGDIFASSFLSYYTNSNNFSDSVIHSVNFTYSTIKKAVENGEPRAFGVPFEELICVKL